MKVMMPEMNFIHDHGPVWFISLLAVVKEEELLTDSTEENGSLLQILTQNTWYR
jgi:hypothetical protein